MVPCAEMVRFGKNGSDVTSAAVRVARAYTGRDLSPVRLSRLAGLVHRHDYARRGVPQAVRELTLTFEYNDMREPARCLLQHPKIRRGDHGAGRRGRSRSPASCSRCEELARRHGALFIFDEVVTGFRVALGGAQEHFGVTPDLACFGKAMANGFPFSAVVGRRDVM